MPIVGEMTGHQGMDVYQSDFSHSDETLAYDPLKRIGIGTSVLGTSEAVGIGAYAFALHEIDKG